MNPIEVQLIPEHSFTVQCGERRIEGMRIVGEWQGMTLLRAADGAVLVVDPLAGRFERAFIDLWKNAGHAAPDDYPRAAVVKGSPSLLAALVEPLNVQAKRAAEGGLLDRPVRRGLEA